MRSCLIQILVLVALVFALLWFGLPLAVGALATSALGSSGFSGTDTRVDVGANPPFELLTGHADSIHISSGNATLGDLQAATVDVTLADVDLFGRTFGTVTGTLGGVQVAAPNGDPVKIDLVTLEGPGSSTTATATMSTAAAQALAVSQLKAVGVTAKVSFKAPDAVVMKISSGTFTGRLITTNGSLILVPDSNSVPSVTLISPSGKNPFHVDSVRVGLAGLTLVGMIDVEKLLS
jgi:hypothetical protein